MRTASGARGGMNLFSFILSGRRSLRKSLFLIVVRNCQGTRRNFPYRLTRLLGRDDSLGRFLHRLTVTHLGYRTISPGLCRSANGLLIVRSGRRLYSTALLSGTFELKSFDMTSRTGCATGSRRRGTAAAGVATSGTRIAEVVLLITIVAIVDLIAAPAIRIGFVTASASRNQCSEENKR